MVNGVLTKMVDGPEFCIDQNGHFWFGFYEGALVKYNGESFEYFNNPLFKHEISPDNLTIGPDTSIWVTIGSGLYNLKNGTWKEYAPDNSPFSKSPGFHSISIDQLGNLWLSSGLGIFIFKEGGVTLPSKGYDQTGVQVFPNPFKNYLNISLPEAKNAQVDLYDLSGRGVSSKTFLRLRRNNN